MFVTRNRFSWAIGGALLAALGLGACDRMMVQERAFLPPTPDDVLARITAMDSRLATNALLLALRDYNSTQPQAWRNSDTGHEGTITPVRWFTTENGVRCAEYRELIVVGPALNAITVNTACQVGANGWAIMNDAGDWVRIA